MHGCSSPAPKGTVPQPPSQDELLLRSKIACCFQSLPNETITASTANASSNPQTKAIPATRMTRSGSNTAISGSTEVASPPPQLSLSRFAALTPSASSGSLCALATSLMSASVSGDYEKRASEYCDPAISLWSLLCDGHDICLIANAIKPGIVKRPRRSSQNFVQTGNIKAFIDGCVQNNLIPPDKIFTVKDLYQADNMPKVIEALLYLLKDEFCDDPLAASASLPLKSQPISIPHPTKPGLRSSGINDPRTLRSSSPPTISGPCKSLPKSGRSEFEPQIGTPSSPQTPADNEMRLLAEQGMTGLLLSQTDTSNERTRSLSPRLVHTTATLTTPAMAIGSLGSAFKLHVHETSTQQPADAEPLRPVALSEAHTASSPEISYHQEDFSPENIKREEQEPQSEQQVEPQLVQPQPVQPQQVHPQPTRVEAQPQQVQPQPVQPQQVQPQPVQPQQVQPQPTRVEAQPQQPQPQPPHTELESSSQTLCPISHPHIPEQEQKSSKQDDLPRERVELVNTSISQKWAEPQTDGQSNTCLYTHVNIPPSPQVQTQQPNQDFSKSQPKFPQEMASVSSSFTVSGGREQTQQLSTIQVTLTPNKTSLHISTTAKEDQTHANSPIIFVTTPSTLSNLTFTESNNAPSLHTLSSPAPSAALSSPSTQALPHTSNSIAKPAATSSQPPSFEPVTSTSSSAPPRNEVEIVSPVNTTQTTCSLEEETSVVEKEEIPDQTQLPLNSVEKSCMIDNSRPFCRSTGICSLNEVLRNPDLLKSFREYLTTHHAIENLDFYLDSLLYRQSMQKEALRLYATYCAQNAQREVNISNDSRVKLDVAFANVLAANGAVTHSLFDSARRDVEETMNVELLPQWHVIHLGATTKSIIEGAQPHKPLDFYAIFCTVSSLVLYPLKRIHGSLHRVSALYFRGCLEHPQHLWDIMRNSSSSFGRAVYQKHRLVWQWLCKVWRTVLFSFL
ncbi:hypothetical protein Pelo_13817 [Pelomyxa schiedti]|nr:hypothetical protein Pelo_13817 [Pelomyxa schiedti]